MVKDYHLIWFDTADFHIEIKEDNSLYQTLYVADIFRKYGKTLNLSKTLSDKNCIELVFKVTSYLEGIDVDANLIKI